MELRERHSFCNTQCRFLRSQSSSHLSLDHLIPLNSKRHCHMYCPTPHSAWPPVRGTQHIATFKHHSCGRVRMYTSDCGLPAAIVLLGAVHLANLNRRLSTHCKVLQNAECSSPTHAVPQQSFA
jgi:hypothetical protein